MTDVPDLNPRTPKELLDAGKQIALKSDVWSDLSIEQIAQKIKDIFGFDIPNWEQLTANFAELRQAIDDTYTGTNPALLAIQGTIGVLRRLAAGIIEPWRLPLIPLSHIGEASPNLLENGGFDGTMPIEETEGWTFNPAVGRTSPGSAQTTGNGTRRVLLSNVVLCAPEQKFDIGGFVTWSMLTGGDTGAFKLSAVAYDDTESVVEEKVIAQIDNPSGAQAWTGLLGQYTVPAGTTKIRVQVEVAATVTGGTINWDDLSVTKYGNLPQRMVAGLVSALGDLGAGIAAAVEAMGNFFDKLTGKIGTTIADLQSWAGQLKTILSGGTVGSGIFPTLDDGLRGIVSGVQGFAQAILEKIVQAIRGIPVVGAGLADLFDDVAGLRSTADTANATAITADTKAVTAQASAAAAQSTATSVQSDLGSVVEGIWNGWFGGGGSGQAAEAQQTIEAIKDAVMNGYLVQTVTSSMTWNKPANLSELTVICVGAGQNGANGSQATGGAGGAGGLSGGFLAQAIDPATVAATVAVTIGASNGAATSFGSHATSTPGAGGIATSFGYSATSSIPGDGGAGGKAATTESGGGGRTAGVAGGSTPLGAGGAAGSISSNSGGAGGAGGAVSASVPTKCGGGGAGGGGGGAWAVGATGGGGGNGGYPGGGAGGGGGSAKGHYSFAGNAGTGGSGASGVAWIFTKTGA